MSKGQSREVDWPLIEGAKAEQPRRADTHSQESSAQLSHHGRLERLLLLAQSLQSNLSLHELCHQVAAALREHLDLDRVAIFVLGPGRHWFQGMVGTNQQGQLVDERGLRHLLDPCDEELFQALAQGQRSFEVLDNAPWVSHEKEKTQVLGRGWLVKTPLLFQGQGFGMLYNDPALCRKAHDRLTQEMAAAFLALVAAKLHHAWLRFLGVENQALTPAVAGAVELMHADPALSHEQIAKRLNLSVRRLSSAYLRETGVSLSEARNALRLEKFLTLVEQAQRNAQELPLLDLALDAGFGSYAQFHRIFKGSFKQSPRDYFRERHQGKI